MKKSTDNMPQVFSFDNHQLRTLIDEKNDILFVAKDVCDVLGIKNTKQAIKNIETRLKEAGLEGVISNDTLVETTGGKQKLITINEQGFYELCFGSRKKSAVQLRAKVTGEILPQIRKTGFYQPNPKTANVNNPPTLELNKRKFLKSEENNKECYFLTSEFANVFKLDHNNLMDEVSAFANTYKNNYSAKYLEHELIIFTVRNKKHQALIHHSVFLLFTSHKKEYQQLVIGCVNTIADFYQKQKQALLEEVQQSKDDFNKGSYYITNAEEIIDKNLNSVINFDTETPIACLNILEGLKNEMDNSNPQFVIISACEALIKSTITHNTTQFEQIKVMLGQIRSNINRSEFHLIKIHGNGTATGWMSDEYKKNMLRKLN